MAEPLFKLQYLHKNNFWFVKTIKELTLIERLAGFIAKKTIFFSAKCVFYYHHLMSRQQWCFWRGRQADSSQDKMPINLIWILFDFSMHKAVCEKKISSEKSRSSLKVTFWLLFVCKMLNMFIEGSICILWHSRQLLKN
jgi:hypothetical protein